MPAPSRQRRCSPLFVRVLLILALLAPATAAHALPAEPLLILNAYIESNPHCSDAIVEWNRKYNARTIAGDALRTFYYRVISFQEWGGCGRPFFKPIFSELQKTWLIYAAGRVSEAEADAKEAELINLMFAALRAGDDGAAMVAHYEQDTTARLMRLVPEHLYFKCTFFGDKAACTP